LTGHDIGQSSHKGLSKRAILAESNLGTVVALVRPSTAGRFATLPLFEGRAMSTTTKGSERLDHRTAQEIDGFLRARRVDLARQIRRGFDERQEHAGADDSDQVASASRTLDHEVQATLVDRASQELAQVDAALDLLRERRYGLCRECGTFIGLARLRSLPFAQRCRPCQERVERTQVAESRRPLAVLAAADPD
jgi:DnaK suppressor protein